MSRSRALEPDSDRVSSAILRRPRRGIAIAVSRAAVTAAAWALPAIALSGCITQDLRFVPPTNFPPSIEVPVGGAYPLDEVIQIRADQLGGGGDAGPINTLVFDLEVRDPDVDQELQYLVYIDYQRGITLFPNVTGFVQPAPASQTNRRARMQRLLIPVRDSLLREPGCHRIEVLMAERFRIEDGVPTRDPIVSGDLGTATWWVATQATEGDAVDMTGCP